MSHASFLPPCRSGTGGKGSTPLVEPWPMSELASHSRQPNHQVDASRSRGCDTACRADGDGSARQDRRPLAPPTHAERPGSGQRPSPCDRTADTTGSGTGTPYERAATAWCSPFPRSSRAVARPRGGESRSDHHGGSARGTRGLNTGGGVYAAWGHLQTGTATPKGICLRVAVKADRAPSDGHAERRQGPRGTHDGYTHHGVPRCNARV